MANVIITPNMNIPSPVPGVDPGPDYAVNQSNAMNIIDQHNHVPGAGVQIPVAGLNINANLPFNTNSATGLKSLVFIDQTSNSVLNSLYTISSELWYNDGTSSVQITSLGNVNATSFGITDGTASAAFSGSGPYTLIVNTATSTPANIQAASILLGNNVASSKYLTLSPPGAMAASFGLVLPSIPAAQSFLSIDTSGNIVAYANVSAGLTSSNLSASAGILGSQLSASANIIGSQLSSSAGIVGGQIASGTISGSKLVTSINLPGGSVAINGTVAMQGNPSMAGNLFTLRAIFNSSGTLIGGEGATCTVSSTGVYVVHFTNTFSTSPVVVVCGFNNSGFIASVSAVSTTQSTILTSDLTGTAISEAFSIIAIG